MRIAAAGRRGLAGRVAPPGSWYHADGDVGPVKMKVEGATNLG
jgi:hypothetical protein